MLCCSCHVRLRLGLSSASLLTTSERLDKDRKHGSTRERSLVLPENQGDSLRLAGSPTWHSLKLALRIDNHEPTATLNQLNQLNHVKAACSTLNHQDFPTTMNIRAALKAQGRL